MTDQVPFVLVTGNPGKLAEARRMLNLDIEAVEIDLPELQSLDLHEVLEAKADEAWRRVREPLTVEETGLELPVLNGFPGPLVKWMLQAVGPEGIARTATGLGDPRATARCLIEFRNGSERFVAEGATEGTLVLPPRGGEGFGWDPVFRPVGEEKTYGELAPEEKDRLSHRGRAWRNLLDQLDL